ncbi:MAG: hypothetical protein ACTHQM_13970 [Thermoanaerobaculia bacterium]
MRFAIPPIVALFLLSCPPARVPALPPGPDDPVANLTLLDRFADRVQRDSLLASWRTATEPESVNPSARIGVVPLLLLQDDEVRALNARLQDPAQSRCLQAIHDFSIELQSESDRDVVRTLSSIAALRNQLPILGTTFTDESDLAVREQLWMSQADTARALAPLIRDLVAARQRWARQRSQSEYLELIAQHRGYDPRTAQKLEQQVRLAFASSPPMGHRAWEFELIDLPLAQRMSQRFDAAGCLNRASFVFTLLGLTAQSSAVQVKPAKRTAFSEFASYAIDPPSDHRIVASPGAGIVPHWSAFHELGHAAVSLMAEPQACRTMRRPVSQSVSESCAKVAERLFYAEEWLQAQDVPESEIHALQNWETESERMRMRSILADLEFERVIYAAPRGDWVRDYATIQATTAGVQASDAFPEWALKRHLAFEPLTRMDYLLARCAQAAVYRRLRVLPGGLLGTASQKVLREDVFRGASSMRYEEWFRSATGSEPNCAAWLEDVARVRSGTQLTRFH